MKKNQPAGRRSPESGFPIVSRSHTRTLHSPAAGGSGSRRHKRRRQGMLLMLIILPLLVVLAVMLWLILPALLIPRSEQTTVPSSGSTSSVMTSTTATTSISATTSSEAATTAATTATLSAGERAERLAQAAAAVQALIGSKAGRFAVSFKNLASGESWSLGADQPFVAASSIKMAINTYLYTKLAAGEISADDILAYDSRPYPTGDYESGTGTIQGMPDGTTFTVRETSGLSIRISDNCATNMIIRRLGGIDRINAYLKTISSVVDYRAKISYLDYAGNAWTGRHRISADDLAAFAVNLYRLWQDHPDVYEPLMDDLCHTEFDFGIQKGIPVEVRVAHKIGTNGTYSAENDVGIVFAAEPFVLCVMTEMASAAAAHQLQADIASIIYEYVEGLHA